MGIIIIELLISGAMKTEHPEDFPLDARDMINTEEPEDLSAKVLALAAKGGWSASGAKKAAKVLMGVAFLCTRGTAKRQTPSQVLDQLEAAHRLTSSGVTSSGGGGWFS
jgi:hypothetical protein